MGRAQWGRWPRCRRHRLVLGLIVRLVLRRSVGSVELLQAVLEVSVHLLQPVNLLLDVFDGGRAVGTWRRLGRAGGDGWQRPSRWHAAWVVVSRVEWRLLHCNLADG